MPLCKDTMARMAAAASASAPSPAPSAWKPLNSDGLVEEVAGAQCYITLSPGAGGLYRAKMYAWGKLMQFLHHEGGWPRDYDTKENARADVTAWMRKRGQWIVAMLVITLSVWEIG